MKLKDKIIIIFSYFFFHYCVFFILKNHSDKYVAIKIGLEQVMGKNVIILGDSHTAYSIKNKYIKNDTYNFSYPGESIIGSRIKFNKISKINNLNTIIISISPHSITEKRGKISSILHFYPEFSFSEININKNISFLDNVKIVSSFLIPTIIEDSRYLVQKYVINKFFNLYDLNKIKSFYYDDFNDCVQGKSSWSRLKLGLREKLAQKRFNALFDSEISLSLINEYELLIEDCNRKNIKVIGILMPISNEFKLLTETNKKWIEGLDIFRNLGFDKILDYRNIFDVNQEYFLDSDHVNLTGSEILTAKLNKDLKKILKPYGSEQ